LSLIVILAALSELRDARHSSYANLPYASQVKDSAYGSVDVSEMAVAASRSPSLMKDTAYDRTTSSSSHNIARRQRR